MRDDPQWDSFPATEPIAPKVASLRGACQSQRLLRSGCAQQRARLSFPPVVFPAKSDTLAGAVVRSSSGSGLVVRVGVTAGCSRSGLRYLPARLGRSLLPRVLLRVQQEGSDPACH